MKPANNTLGAVRQAAQAARDKKAEDLLLLDLQETASFTDYFLLCTGFSGRQVQAISDAVEEQLEARGFHPTHIEGYQQAEWVLLDYVDFVVHVFSPKARSFYQIDRLWRRAARLPLGEERRSDAVGG